MISYEGNFISNRPLIFFGGSAPPASLNPDPILNKKKFRFPPPFSDPGSKIYSRLERQIKDFLKAISNREENVVVVAKF